MWSPCAKQRATLLYHLAPWIRRETVSVSSYSTVNNEDRKEDEVYSPPPAPSLIPKLKPNAVLKALASTVSELDHPFSMGRSMADPITSVSKAKQMKYLMARDAGVDAAKYVIKRWPKLFSSKDFNPDIRPQYGISTDHKSEEETLEYLISEREVGEAVELFNKLEAEGKQVQLATQNNLLELLAHTGLGNAMAQNFKQFEQQHNQLNSNQNLKFLPLGNVETRKRESQLQALVDTRKFFSRAVKDLQPQLYRDSRWYFRFPRAVWSLTNDAEQFFEKMEQKNADTYSALMVGLFKYRCYDRMFSLYDAMIEQRLKPNLSTYNLLLLALDDSKYNRKWDKAMELAENMAKEPAVHPDVTTFNMLLKMSEFTEGRSRENAARLFQEMVYLGIKPNLTTFLRILQTFIYNKIMDKSVVYEIIDYLDKHPEVLKVDGYFDLFFYMAAMNTASNLADPKLARKIMKMTQKDNWHLIAELKNFLSHYLVLLCWYEEDFKSVMDTYKWLVPQHLDLQVDGDWVYGSLFYACMQAKSSETALKLWRDFKGVTHLNSINPIRMFHMALGGVHLDVNEIEKYLKAAEESWHMLLSRDLTPDTLVISSMIRLHTLGLKMDKAWFYHHQFKKFNLKPTIFATRQIANTYANFLNDTDKTVETYQVMIKEGHPKPKNFGSVCEKLSIPLHIRKQLEKGFMLNKVIQ